MNEMMKEQFLIYLAKSVIILDVAGGNGLEHIDAQAIEKVYVVYQQKLKGMFKPFSQITREIRNNLY